MASTLAEWTNKQVCVITCDGRSIVGIMAGDDQLQNLILKDASERVYSPDADPETVPLGLYVIRGDNIAIISDRDEEREASVNLDKVRAEPIESVVQNIG
mmetsp:Transcript_26706/g.57942  ORF Transcript_26706/g.57942 Transcript_26706/m.57942 type:complete len:100 (-) Transcript_26706:358-657(-)